MNHSAAHPFDNYLAISLWISSVELTPESITQLVGLQPTHTRLRGSVIPGRNILRRPEFDVHEWEFRRQLDAKSGIDLGQFAERFITEFLSIVKAYTAKIKKLSEHQKVGITFVYHVDTSPYIGLTHDQVEAIADLGAKLDYDLMIEEDGFNEADKSHSVEVE